MASLTETSIISRKIIRYGFYLLIFLISFRFIFNSAKAIYLKIFPPPPPKATVAFGKLPKLPFPEKDFPKGLNIKIETADTSLPKFPIHLPVYEMPPIPQSIDALEQARSIAERLRFEGGGVPLLESTPNIYRFVKKDSPSSLRINILSKIFSIDYNILQDPSVVLGPPISHEQALTQIVNYLKSANLIRPDIDKDAVITHQYYKVEIDKFVPVSSQSEGNVVKINIFRKNFGPESSIPSKTPEFPEANIWFMVGNRGIQEIIRGEYYYFPIDESKFATYPIITAEEAIEKLKQGKAYLVSLDQDTKDITIRKIYLAYYDAGQYTPYYQPIVVFEGDNNFLSYVPAVVDEFYGTETTK
jgi:hypothetical protein